jgi:phenylacetic acid degradation operon negative regulatory protein
MGMSRKRNYSGKIIKILGQKPATPIKEIESGFEDQNKYSVTRSLKNLRAAGLIESIHSPQKEYARLTKEGRKKMHSLALENDMGLVPAAWDGRWRIIILDLDEARKSEREALRYLLKKANFTCVKNTVWISPLPYEHLFENIKKDLGLTTELMIIVSDNLDPETSRAFLEALKN